MCLIALEKDMLVQKGKQGRVILEGTQNRNECDYIVSWEVHNWTQIREDLVITQSGSLTPPALHL